MIDVLNQHMSGILSFLAGCLAGSFITLKITRQNKASGNGSIVDQSKSRAGGDIVGGNKR
jgi:hypothetical protein